MMNSMIENPIVQIVCTWLLGLITSIVVYKIENKANKRTDIPQLNMTLVVKGSVENMEDELNRYEHCIKFFYKEHETIDEIQSPRKSIRFIEISANKVKKEFHDTNFLILSFEGGKDIGFMINELYDNEYNEFGIDEKKILVNRMGGGRYCLICEERDKPIKITGVYDEKHIAYNIGTQKKGFVKAKFGK